METKLDQLVPFKEKGNSNLQLVGSIKRPKNYLFKKNKGFSTSVNKNDFKVRNKKINISSDILKKDRMMATKKITDVNNLENKLNENKRKLVQDFNDSCINIMLSNRMARKR